MLDVADTSADGFLLLGPLYHLPDASDRARAFAEAVRATRPGGVICAAAVSRYAWPLYALRDGGSLEHEQLVAMSETLETGLGDPIGALPAAFSHRARDLATELRAAGAADIEVRGIEGPGWTLLSPDVSGNQANALLDVAVRVARLLDGHADMAASSTHLLAVGRRP